MVSILWVDDEIDLLKPHIIYLDQKGYNVQSSRSGDEALDLLKLKNFDLIFLDENMTGLSGLETLALIKEKYPRVPVIMITKNEEESIMDEAIGSKISDYLIKPVNPRQILLAIKKNIETNQLVRQKMIRKYQSEFNKLSRDISSNLDHNEWKELYKRIVFWELEIGSYSDVEISDILEMQKVQANNQFCKFITKNYKSWLHDNNSPLLSNKVFQTKVFPEIEKNKTLYFVLIDNLRYDQWKMISSLVSKDFDVLDDDIYYSILPTSTQYSRNSLFSGLFPLEIQKKFPEYWRNDSDEGGKNMYEELFLRKLVDEKFHHDIKLSYNKITNIDFGRKFVNQINNLSNNDLNVIVYNFVDMLSHARTDMKVIKELAEDDYAYRSLTLSWFEHSPLREILKKISEQAAKLIITTDHGTINVEKPIKIIGDRNVNSNLRYKQGKNLNFKANEVFEISDPHSYFLPKQNISSKYIFNTEKNYFVYQNNYNNFVNFYKNTYQHGGISMEEMLVPIIKLNSKK